MYYLLVLYSKEEPAPHFFHFVGSSLDSACHSNTRGEHNYCLKDALPSVGVRGPAEHHVNGEPLPA